MKEKVNQSRRGFFKKIGLGTLGVAGVALTNPIKKLQDIHGHYCSKTWKEGCVTFIEYVFPQDEHVIFLNTTQNSQVYIPMYNISKRDDDEKTIIAQSLGCNHPKHIPTLCVEKFCYIIRVNGQPNLLGVYSSSQKLICDSKNPHRHVG